ncbi:hypothetical protein Back11_58790 [Paenibacillus baekrokdamisoli]|uniref:5-formyltetrahydrofolate cyclo-ligase n=1 Tax=Paenibacillus baekrokdamisoli TaxID=1712516 RepID=A0A3G9JNV1_9BACL|nr:5-formyltetrahydrofolate cyclo-ligase [Paenibacillus baekrokdamisoli]MBB3071433.1 5-formyltetrahydrofolate cyclo-ligase [Paenibacillus baekrokdamisoli]BBH24534.1 hypothetical protein Back11_58790 [Paenibacillus baekrokdamisoli]
MDQSRAINEFPEWKKEARAAASNNRDGLPQQLQAEWSAATCRVLVDWLEHQQRDARYSFMTYVPFRSELDTKPLLEWGWRSNHLVIVPRCVRADRSMELYIISSWDELISGAYGILEPDPTRAKRCEASFVPELVIVPGLAFDLAGGRLGYGGGYYDRFNERLHQLTEEGKRPFPLWLGVGYDTQWMEEVPMDHHDARMDAVVTEQGFQWMSTSASKKLKGAKDGSDTF